MNTGGRKVNHEPNIELLVESIKEQYSGFEEDFPGQAKERVRERAVEIAVSIVQKIAMETSEGSAEETDYLESAIATKLVEKVHGRLWSRLVSYDLKERLDGIKDKRNDSEKPKVTS